MLERAVGEFVSALSALDVRCWVEGDRLRLSAPREALTVELREELTRRKDEILTYLRAVKTGASSAPPLARVPRNGGQPLSFAQERLWFLQKLDPESVVYNLQANVRFAGGLDRSALERALAELVRRHEPLRTRFEEREGRPVQVIALPSPVELPVVDLGPLGRGDRPREAQRVASEQVRRPFDLPRGPAFRTLLLRLGADDHRLLVTQHHIITDGWSIALLVEEVLALYRAFAAGLASPLPEPARQYVDFACWQREWLQGETLERQLSYWRERLRGARPALDLPTDRPRPAVQTANGETLRFELTRQISDEVEALSRAEGATPFITLLAAFTMLLSRYSGEDDVVVGTANGNRSLVETERMLGLFVNTVVLRTDLSGDPSFREVLARVRKVSLEAHSYGDLPFEKLVEELRPPRDLSRSPVFQVLFVIQNTPLAALTRLGDEGAIGERGTAAYDLSLYVTETDRGFAGSLEYNTDLFDAETARRFAAHYQELLGRAVAHPERRISELTVLGEAERHRILVEWNATEKPVPARCAHELVESQAARTPQAVAVEFEGQSLTYAELDRRANRLAHRLRRLGVRPGVLAGLHTERSLDMMVGLLGILKAGGAYVPLDPAYPTERLQWMLADARPAVVLTQRGLADGLPAFDGHRVTLDEPTGEDGGESPLPSGAGPDHLAYVIFTSGSTGRPKGVAIPHRALANLLASMREEPGLSARDTLLAVTTLAFDIAGLELLLPLIAGGRIVLASRETAIDGAALGRLLAQSGATVMQATPATWRMLIASGWRGDPRLKILCGGEALPSELARELRERGASLWNVYGPTETTIWSTVHAVREVTTPVPIGRPIANTRVHVLDARLQPVPIGVSGELYIGGTGVARGYLGRSDLTAERFVPDPFGGERGGRLYRTGDRARYRVDGTVECLGRIDHQLKLRGFRIEPAEIEAALREHGAVGDCVVVARDGAGSDRRLVAYLVASTSGPPAASELRAFLKRRLPDYMVPAVFVTLAALPRTPNGKVDRRALPDPDPGRSGLESAYVPPGGPVEEAVAAIWSEVLGRERVGAHDNFFDLGGHSLNAAQVLSRIQDAFQVQIPLRRVFEAPTVAGLAESVERARQQGSASETPPLAPLPEGAEQPLSFAQERLWFLDRLEEERAVYNIPGALYLKGRLDQAALEKSLAEIWRRHEGLRALFGDVEGRPVLQVASAENFELGVTDLAATPVDLRRDAGRRLIVEEARLPFDLSRGPLFRCRLLRFAEEEHVLLATLHHIVADEWSLGIVVRELSALYAAFSHGEPSPLPEPPVQYADYAHWQRRLLSGERLEREVGYWRSKLADLSTLDLPLDHARPPLQTFRGAMHHFRVPPELAAQVKSLARAEKATLFMTLMAAFQTLLHRYSGQEDVAVGMPIAGRARTELEGIVGLFANTLVFRTDLGGDPTFRTALARVRETALETYAHQDMPFERLVEALRPNRNLSVHPLFQVMFVLQNAPAASLQLEGLGLSPIGVETGASRFDLTLFLRERADSFYGTLEYNTDLFEAPRMERLAGHFESLLAGIVEAPDRRLSELPLLTERERTQLLVEWNDTAEPPAVERCAHASIAAQAGRTPDAIAVSFEGEALSYRALDVRANQLAHRLRKLGVGPEVLVAIGLERSLDMVVALLATLKAGGAYLPLDPGYPRDRLAFMIEDAGARILLTQESLRDAVPAGAAHVFCLDAERQSLAAESDAAPAELASADNLAYVIYTSGSTGRPKGVQVTHRALASFLSSMAVRPGLHAGDVLLAVTTLSFDIAGLELYLPLTVGARVELASREAAADGSQLRERLECSGATVMQATPATWRLLIEAGWPGGPLAALCGGEALPGDLADELLQRGVSLWNLYGPTETTIWSALQRVEKAESSATLGRPIANTEMYILDRTLKPVPVGVAGELFIGGLGVARGYRNRPDLTADRFRPDPFGPRPGGRLYRTGDLARHHGDGSIEFRGRIDNQVKVRGFRIELGEVEATLLGHEAVSAAVALAAGNGPADRQLVAYVTFRPGREATVTELRAHLKKTLPPYMVPSSVAILDALPLTPNGKVDRNALSRLESGQTKAAGPGVEPRTAVERLVADVWKEALGLDRVSVHDNFFDLGGHSLLSMRVLARIEKALGARLGPRELIFQTLEQFAAMCEERVPQARDSAVSR